MNPALSVWALSGLLLWVAIKAIRELYLSPLSKVPGPRWAAVTYLDEFYHQAIRNDWGAYLRDLHRRYGSIVRISPGEVSILDHDFSYVHFNRRNLDKEERYFQLAPRSTATITPHSEHKVRRDIIIPLFNGKCLRQFEASLPQYLTKTESHLVRHARSGEPLDLTHLVWAASNDVLVKFVFGSELGLLDQDDLAAGYELRTFNAMRLASIFRQWPLVLLFKARNLPFVRSVAALPVEALVAKMTTPLFIPPGARPDSKSQEIGGIARTLHDNHQLYRDPRVLNPELAEFMLGGTEAITYNSIHVFHALMSQPEILKKVRTELDSLNAQGNVWEDPRVTSLPYMNAVVREALRMNDSEQLRFVRQSRETVTYRNIALPPSTTISMSEVLLNWDPEIFPDPEQFRPGRWLTGDPVAERAKKLFVAFGVGNRTCVGKDFALSVIIRIVVAVVATHDLSFWSEAEKDGWGIGYLRIFPPRSVKGPMVAVKTRAN